MSKRNSAVFKDVLKSVQISEEDNKIALHAMEDLEKRVKDDKSPAAQRRRVQRAIKAIYGEFVCTLIYFTLVFSCIAHGTLQGWSPYDFTFTMAMISGLGAIAVIFTFSSISGAHFNCNISFALWLTGKLSNRKCFFYILVQLLASVLAMGIVGAIFHGDMNKIYDSCVVVPPDADFLGKTFSTEFFCTFILTYVAFTVVFEEAETEKMNTMTFKGISDTKGLTVYTTTPQSRTGFAPFAIGFLVFGLALVGGSSGPAFNQARMFGPALITGRWDFFYIYYLAQLLGATSAALIVDNLARFGLDTANEYDEEVPISAAAASAAISKLRADGRLPIEPAEEEVTAQSPLLDAMERIIEN